MGSLGRRELEDARHGRRGEVRGGAEHAAVWQDLAFAAARRPCRSGTRSLFWPQGPAWERSRRGGTRGLGCSWASGGRDPQGSPISWEGGGTWEGGAKGSAPGEGGLVERQLLEAFCTALPHIHRGGACRELRTHLLGFWGVLPCPGSALPAPAQERGIAAGLGARPCLLWPQVLVALLCHDDAVALPWLFHVSG